MSASLDEDLTVLEHLDFEPACELRRHGEEDESANWYIVTNDCPRCGDAKRLFCDSCKEFAEQVNGRAVFCRGCKVIRTIRIARIEALK